MASETKKWVAWMWRDDHEGESLDDLRYCPDGHSPPEGDRWERTPWLDKPAEPPKHTKWSDIKAAMPAERREALEQHTREEVARLESEDAPDEDYMEPIDHFAAAALNGLLASGNWKKLAETPIEEDAYDYADAMMSERAKRRG